MNKEKHLAVIILNWNGYKDTIACVKSLIETGWDQKHIFIIDNGSTDNSVPAIRNNFPESINVVTLRQNYGFSGGMNHGLKLAEKSGFKYALLLNNDTQIIKNETLKAYVDAFSMDRSIGVVSARIMNDRNGIHEQKDPIVNSQGMMKFIYKYLFPAYQPISKEKDSILSNNPALKEKPMLHGVAMGVRLEILSEIGYFNEKFFCYEEDRDFMIRVRKFGYKLVLLKDFWIYHKWSGSTKRNSDFVIYHRARNLGFMVNQYYSLRYIIFSYIKLLAVSIKNRRFKSFVKGVIHYLTGQPTSRIGYFE